MDHWKAFFSKAGADIWTIIEQAIIVAATDYPKDFKEKRGEIAETLFARRLLQLHSGDTDVTRLSGSVVTNANQTDGNDMRDDEEEGEHTREAFTREGDARYYSYGEAEAINDEMEEDTLVMNELNRIKEAIMDRDQSENVLLDLLQRLVYLQVTVEALKKTEIGKHVNGLRKHASKRVRGIVKRLVRGWKDLVDDWVKSAGDAAAAAIAGYGKFESSTEEKGLASPSLNAGAVRTSSLEMSQLPNLMDGDIHKHHIVPCSMAVGTGVAKSKEPSTNANLYLQSNSQSRTLQTDFSNYNGRTSTTYNKQGFTVSEARGNSSRADFDGIGQLKRKLESRASNSENGNNQKEIDNSGRLSTSRSYMGSYGPGRPVNDMPKVKVSVSDLGLAQVGLSMTSQRQREGMMVKRL